MKNQLKIIAIKPLKGCTSHILKVLKEDEPYFFYNNYRETEDKQYIEDFREGLPPNFFSIKSPKDSPNITVTAIVGKNGDGKSSIIELIIRILNNFAHVYKFGSATENLIYIEGINAELFFSITSTIKEESKEIIYKIKLESNIQTRENSIYLFSSHQITKPLWEYKFDLKNNKPIDSKRDKDYLPLDHCFFTMVTNYSSYAYNINDYRNEWSWRDEFNYFTQKHINNNICWIDYLFHKNDGYQTPIVLHPFRQEGNFDVNTEAYLTKQRMISLFLTDDNSPNSFRWINDKQFAESIEFKFEEKSKLDTKAFYNYFKNIYYYDSYTIAGEVPQIGQLNDKLDLYSNKDNIPKDLKEKIAQEGKTINKIRRSFKRFIEEEKELIRRAYEIKEQLKKNLKNERNNDESLDKETDFFKLLSDYNIFQKHLNRLGFVDSQYQIEEELDELSSYTLIQFNANQFIRIALVAYHKKIWREKLQHLGVSTEKLESEIGQLLFDYLIYKSISIVNKYPQYQHNRHIDTVIGFLIDGELTQLTREAHRTAIEDIFNNSSHITLKMRQALTFLNVDLENNRIYEEDIYDLLVSCSEDKELKVDILMSSGVESQTEIVKILNIEKYYNKIILISPEENRLIEFIPPPIFETDVILKQKDKDEKSRLSHLSSGERQLIGNVSSVIYHLRNINSVKREKKTTIGGSIQIYKYKHINLFFEEVELYFHPEFQRQFINYLLKSISKIKLKNIDSINMCFVTHSPFILSDIPKVNVLFLENGQSRRCMDEDTFGANIYDLLNNSFFLNKYSGEFALTKIGDLITDVNSISTNATELQIKNIEKRIKLVGEPFIRTQLYNTLYTNIKDTNRFRIAELEEELKELKK